VTEQQEGRTIMKFTSGLLLGFILGVGSMIVTSGHAQLAPFDAPLGQQLQGQWAEQYLSMQRDLERREAQTYSPYSAQRPCPY
jgi:hypothetical protein